MQELIRFIHFIIQVCDLSFPFLYILNSVNILKINNIIFQGVILIVILINLSLIIFKRCILFDMEEKFSSNGKIKNDMIDNVVEIITNQKICYRRYDIQFDITDDNDEYIGNDDSFLVLKKRDKYIAINMINIILLLTLIPDKNIRNILLILLIMWIWFCL